MDQRLKLENHVVGALDLDEQLAVLDFAAFWDVFWVFTHKCQLNRSHNIFPLADVTYEALFLQVGVRILDGLFHKSEVF